MIVDTSPKKIKYPFIVMSLFHKIPMNEYAPIISQKK